VPHAPRAVSIRWLQTTCLHVIPRISCSCQTIDTVPDSSSGQTLALDGVPEERHGSVGTDGDLSVLISLGYSGTEHTLRVSTAISRFWCRTHRAEEADGAGDGRGEQAMALAVMRVMHTENWWGAVGQCGVLRHVLTRAFSERGQPGQSSVTTRTPFRRTRQSSWVRVIVGRSPLRQRNPPRPLRFYHHCWPSELITCETSLRGVITDDVLQSRSPHRASTLRTPVRSRGRVFVPKPSPGA
jgi:hypothetical protein